MKILKLVVGLFSFCLSLMSCGVVSKAEHTALQVELKKEEDLNQQLEEQYKVAISQLEEMIGKNTELNELIDKQKEELAKCKSKKKN